MELTDRLSAASTGRRCDELSERGSHVDENPWVIAVTDESFEAQVLQRSYEQLVLVDFWAEWCGPCRMLGPVLEKLAADYDGQFLLAKANTDQTAQAAGQFGVQSIPAVFAVRDGQLVDAFVGALPEPQLRPWIDRLLPTAAEKLVAEAEKLTVVDPATAEKKYREAMAADANLASARIGLIQLFVDQNRHDEAAQPLAELEARGFLEPEAERLKAILALREHAATAGDIEQCRAAAAQHPSDLSRQLKLAEALAGVQQYEEALQVALVLVQTDRQNLGEPARQLMVDIFRQLPDDSPLTSQYRRKLSAALY